VSNRKRYLLFLAICSPALFIGGCLAHSGIKGPALVDFAPAGFMDKTSKPKRMALVVGIDSFEDKHFNSLKYAVEDAEALGAKLKKSFDLVRVLDTPGQTRRASILEAIADIGEQANDARDTVLFYFSTHGSLGRKPGGSLERFLVAADTRMNLLAQTGIPVDGLLRVVDNIPAKRKLVVLASCHSGQGKSRVDDDLAKALASLKSGSTLPPLEDVSEATIILTASAFGETARESEKLGHDIYTYFFLQALDPAIGDRDGNGAVTASEAHDYARKKTYEYTHGMQRPTAESSILGRDPIVLTGDPDRPGRPVLFSYAPSAEGLEVDVDGTAKGLLPGGIVVPEGKHELALVEARGGKTLFKGEISLKQGDTVELTRLLPPPADIALMAGGSFEWPLLATTRGEYLPYTFGANLGVRMHNWPNRGFVLMLNGNYHGGKGRSSGLGETLPFEFDAVGFDIGLGYSWSMPHDLYISPGLSVGTEWNFRKFDTGRFSKQESMWGFKFGAELAIEWEPVSGLLFVPKLLGGGMVAGLGNDMGPHPFIGLAFSVGGKFPMGHGLQ